MRDKNGPRIQISGAMMVRVPEDITIEQAFGNFEELARGTQVAGAKNRMQLLGSLVSLGRLVAEGHLPEVSVRDALANFEQIGMAFECNHHQRMAIIKSVDLLEDLVEAEETRLEQAAKEADGPDEAEADRTSEAASEPKSVSEETTP